MHGVLLAVLVIACGIALARTARRARGLQGRPRSRARGGKGGWLAHRRTLRLERLRHENATARDKAKHEQRLAEQEARAAAGDAPDGNPGGRRPRGGTVRSRVVRIGDEPAPPPPQDPSGQAAPPAPPAPPPKPPARVGSGPRPAPPVPGPPPPPPPRSSRSSGGSTVTAAPFAESVIDGINSIAAHARTGNILAKRRAMLALIAICQRAADMALSLSRALAEPGQHYGPEVTEPIAKGAMHLRAASLAFAEADTSLATLLRASLAETMESGRQVPHHDELRERGYVGTAPPNTFVDPVRR